MRLIYLTAIIMLMAKISSADKPIVFNLNADLLQYSKSRYLKGDPEVRQSVEMIVKDAEQALKTEMLSVVSKSLTPPSGSKHDYMSIGPYWWPNPNTQDGLPYIRKDGQVNPEYRTFGDAEKLKTLSTAVQSLTLAYYFTGKEEFSRHAGELIRTWFINPETKMNPNLDFGQSVPGITQGRSYGIIETKGFLEIIDGIGLIRDSKSWSRDDQKAMQEWMSQFLVWLQESEIGDKESKEPNNHGTYWDVQAVTYALFTNQTKKAASFIEKTRQRLISQIKEDGSQPYELARTQSWHYSNMNLKGFLMLVHLTQPLGVKLEDFSEDGHKPIQLALDYFLPYLNKEKKWEHTQLSPLKYDETYYNLRMGGIIYGDHKYEETILKIGDERLLKIVNLLWPNPKNSNEL